MSESLSQQKVHPNIPNKGNRLSGIAHMDCAYLSSEAYCREYVCNFKEFEMLSNML